jgi:signal transduction histidine kinase
LQSPLFTNTTTSSHEGNDLFADFKPSQQYCDQNLFAEPSPSEPLTDEHQKEPLLKEEVKSNPSTKFTTTKWKILIVDDEKDIHEVTSLILRNYVYKGKHLELINAYSAAQAKAILNQHTDIALIFLDVVMESDDAGLRLVRYIREELGNPHVRIILRTGQPGYAPEEKIIIDYEINDYANKTELSRQKLITLTTATLRSYADLMTVELYRQNLEEKVKQRTQELQEKNQELTLLNDKLTSLNDKLTILNQEKNEFLGIAAHDLKNPLSAIKGLAEEISTAFDACCKAEIIEYADMIKAGAEQMFGLIINLLDVNAIESGQFNIALQTTDILPIVQNLVKIYSQRALAKQIAISIQVTDSEYIALVDKNMTHQLLDNLISNAIKYSPLHSQVHIRIGKEPGWISCDIQDEGPGLSAADQQKLFGKFVRLSTRPTAGEHSTGLGLFIVKKLVEAMNSKVSCNSELGKGSIFTVAFPVN